MPPASRKGGNVLTRKLGPAPAWVWLVAAAALYLGYRAYRNRSATAAAQTTSAPPTDQTGTGVSGGGGTSGGGGISDAGGGATTPPDQTSAFQAYSDILGQIEAQNAQLTASLLQQGLAGGASAAGQSPAGTAITPSSNAGAAAPTSQHLGTAPAASALFQWHRVPITAPSFGAQAAAQTQQARAAGVAAPFGGVVSVRRLASGASLTTYASGRQVEQVPGRTAYVVRR